MRILRGARETGLPTLEIAQRMVEQAPGIKSPTKLKALVLALHHATKQDNPSYR